MNDVNTPNIGNFLIKYMFFRIFFVVKFILAFSYANH